MFADPLTVTSDWTTITADSGENLTLAAIERAADHSLYRTAGSVPGNQWDLFIGHQYGRRNRFTVRFTQSGYTPDLIVDGNNSRFSQACYVVFDSPSSGLVNLAASGPPDYHYLMKSIGSFLVSVDTADPLFQRVLNGET